MTKDEFLDMLTEEFKSKTSLKWWVHYPGQVYANDMQFSEPATVKDALDYIKGWLGDRPIPEGTKVWPG